MAKRRPVSDHQPKINRGQPKKVNLARLSVSTGPEMSSAICSCGVVFKHVRSKVRDEWITRHVNAKHGGRAVYM